MSGADRRYHLHIRQPRTIRRATLLPGAIAASAHRLDRSHLGQGVVRARPLLPGVLHCVFLAMSAVALFRVSLSRCRLTLSACRCDRSICSRCTHRGASLVKRPCRGRLNSVPYWVLNQPQRFGLHSGCQPIVDSRDRQCLKLVGVFLPRYLHHPPVQSNCDPTISTGRRLSQGRSITVCF